MTCPVPWLNWIIPHDWDNDENGNYYDPGESSHDLQFLFSTSVMNAMILLDPLMFWVTHATWTSSIAVSCHLETPRDGNAHGFLICGRERHIPGPSVRDLFGVSK